MKIGIDCRLSGVTHAGIGRYIENLTSRLPQLAPQIEWVYFYRTSDQIIDGLNVKYVKAPIRHYTFQEQIQLLSIFNQEKLDLLHIPHFNVPVMYSGKLVVTIHDLLWHQQRGSQVTTLKPWQYWGKYAGYKMVASAAIKKADKILVPTQTIKKTLNQYYPQNNSKVIVTHEGIDQKLTNYKNLKIKSQPYSLIYVGSLYPHKNIRVVLEALSDLPKWKLTIVGSRNVFQENVRKEVKKLGITKQIKFSGYLKDEELSSELMRATALVQPSLSEGFGLTGIEAMALGTPVIASEIPVFKEIYQDKAIYFNPQSSQDFIKQLSKISQAKLGTKEIKEVIKKYSWDEMTKKTMAVYRQLI